MNVFNYNFSGLRGVPVRLEQYRNQPLLIVNTASKCGFTPQYAKLQRLQSDYRDSGLVVVGIPSNDFGEQEPGTEEEIAAFLDSEYRIDFPMAARQKVIGVGMHDLYRDLLEKYGPDILPRWNFHKILFDRKGELVEHWPGEVEPDDPALLHVLTRNLQSWSL